MKTTEIISLSALTVSFVTFWLVYVRDNKKRFQEKIYDLKFEAYQNILRAIWSYLNDAFSLLQEMQEFEGEKQEWLIHIQNESSGYYDKAFQLRDLLNDYVLLLPSQFLDEYEKLSSLAVSHITSYYHYETQITVESYDRLSDSYSELIDLIRHDLGVSEINRSLNKRLARDLYPIGFRNSPKDKPE